MNLKNTQEKEVVLFIAVKYFLKLKLYTGYQKIRSQTYSVYRTHKNNEKTPLKFQPKDL